MRSVIISLACIAFLCACNTSGPVAAFDPAEAAFINSKGNATIEGHAFLRDSHGKVKVREAAGEIVRLVPATAYARARFAQFYGGAKFLPARSLARFSTDPEYAAFTRTTKAESTGRFTFDHVAPGRYFVTTQITWQPNEAFFQEGGAIYEDVTVTGKETDPINVILSGN